MPIDLTHIEETPHVLDILLEIESVLDSLDLYVFKNWILGEIVDGPRIKRHWVSITLKYQQNLMPDPRAGLRLLKHGIMVSFGKGTMEELPEAPEEPVWLVKIEVPRRLISGLNNATTDFYDDEVDSELVDSAKDIGVDDETGITDV